MARPTFLAKKNPPAPCLANIFAVGKAHSRPGPDGIHNTDHEIRERSSGITCHRVTQAVG